MLKGISLQMSHPIPVERVENFPNNRIVFQQHDRHTVRPEEKSTESLDHK